MRNIDVYFKLIWTLGPSSYLTIRASLATRHALFLANFGRWPEGPSASAEGWRAAGPLQELEESDRQGADLLVFVKILLSSIKDDVRIKIGLLFLRRHNFSFIENKS